MYSKTELFAIVTLVWSCVGLTLMLASFVRKKGSSSLREIDVGTAMCVAVTFVFSCLTLWSILRTPETASAEFVECGGIILAGIIIMLVTLILNLIKKRLCRIRGEERLTQL